MLGPMGFFAFLVIAMIVIGTVALHWKIIAFCVFLLAVLAIGLFL